MKTSKTRIYVQNGNHGLDVYLDISGIPHYLVTRRPNGFLHLWLKDGISINELYRVKPRNAPFEQKRFHYAKSLIRLAEDYFKHELIA